MGQNGMSNNTAFFLGMQQQIQQQAGTREGTPQFPGGLRNPIMVGDFSGGAAGASAGAGFNSQAPAALYWSALQASGIGNQQPLGKQFQTNPHGHHVEGSLGVPIAAGMESSQSRQQVRATAECQQSANHGLLSKQNPKQEQPMPQNQDAAQRQDSQTQVLFQQQCLIARLQQQLQQQRQQQQQRQPENNVDMITSQSMSGQQQWNGIVPGLPTSSDSMQQPQLWGNFTPRSSSVGSAAPKLPSQSTIRNNNQYEPSPAMQGRRYSLGCAMNTQQQQFLQHALQSGQSSQQTNLFHELLGKSGQHSANQTSSASSALKHSLNEPIHASRSQGRVGVTKPSHGDAPSPMTPTILDGDWGGHDTRPTMRSERPEQEVSLKVTAASANSLEGAHALVQVQKAKQAQDPLLNQQQLFMANMLQKQVHEGRNSSSVNASRSRAGEGPESGNSESSAPEFKNMSIKHIQTMQYPKQTHVQLSSLGSLGGGSSIGGLQHQWQLQAQLSQSQQLQSLQREREGTPTCGGSSTPTNGGDQRVNGNELNQDTTEGDLSWNNSSNSLPSLRDSLRSTSQGSYFSHNSFNLLDPDPIADGFNTALGGTSANNGKINSGDGKNGQQSFLDGHFAGGWQSNADLPDRRRINFHIIKVIERIRPDANRMSQK